MQNLIAQLSQDLGLKTEQVQAGTGAFLQLIQEKVGQGDFQQVLGKLPGAQEWIQQAKALPQQAGQVGGGLLGQASSLLGSLSGKGSEGLAAVLGRLEQAGFKPDTAMRFVPKLLDQLRNALGEETFERLVDKVPMLRQTAGGLLGQLIRK
ncbi:MAG TPA: DUF2780 domain-containing protein [Nevskiaceae bacterium]|nr:DUF2780 domain-containing protein [Nevskiaceae bacterium]